MISDTIIHEHSLARGLRASDFASFDAEKVPRRALDWTSPRAMAIVAWDTVVFDGAGRFEFRRHQNANGWHSEVLNAYTLPLLDELGDLADILAFRPGGPTGLWLGRVSMAGADNLLMPRPDLGDVLDVHATPLDWLRAGRQGVVLFNYARAARDLAGTTLRVTDREHARRLKVALTWPAPRVIVSCASDKLSFAARALHAGEKSSLASGSGRDAA